MPSQYSTSLMILFGSFSSSFSFAPSTKSLKSSRDSEGTTPGGRGVEGFELEVAAIADTKGGGAGFEPRPRMHVARARA